MKRSVLAVVSGDPGGASALFPVVKELLRRKRAIRVYAGPPSLRIWSRPSTRRHVRPMPDRVSRCRIRKELRSGRTIFLLSGAGAYNRIEHTFRLAASDLGIRCLALVDAWTDAHYSDRFRRETGGRTAYSWPERIGLMDDRSRRTMLLEGVQAEKLVVVGAPHFEHAHRRFQRKTREDIRSARRRVGVAESERVFVFFSQPIAQDLPPAPGNVSGPPYTETDVLAGVVKLVGEHAGKSGVPVTLLLKPHPREADRKYDRWAGRPAGEGFRIRVLPAAEVADLILAADLVLGMTSTVLVEAALAGKTTLSIQFGVAVGSAGDRFFGNVLGLTVPIRSHRALRQWLARSGYPCVNPGSSTPLFRGSTRKVLDLIRRMGHA